MPTFEALTPGRYLDANEAGLVSTRSAPPSAALPNNLERIEVYLCRRTEASTSHQLVDQKNHHAQAIGARALEATKQHTDTNNTLQRSDPWRGIDVESLISSTNQRFKSVRRLLTYINKAAKRERFLSWRELRSTGSGSKDPASAAYDSNSIPERNWGISFGTI